MPLGPLGKSNPVMSSNFRASKLISGLVEIEVTSPTWQVKICWWLIFPFQYNARILKNHPGKWVLIWEYSTRAIQWIPTWQDLDGFQTSLCSCALDEGSLSIGSVNFEPWMLMRIFSIHGDDYCSGNCKHINLQSELNLQAVIPGTWAKNRRTQGGWEEGICYHGNSCIHLRAIWWFLGQQKGRQGCFVLAASHEEKGWNLGKLAVAWAWKKDIL